MQEIILENFHGLKCSRPQCGGDAKIVIEYGYGKDIIIQCTICNNQQKIFDAFKICENCPDNSYKD